MADYIRDLRPAKWGSTINLRSLCALGLGWLFSNSGRALAFPATATIWTRRLREISEGSFLPRRLCSAITADSNCSSSRSSRCLTVFGKSVGRTWRDGIRPIDVIAGDDPDDSEDRECPSRVGSDENRSGVDERPRVPMR